MYVYVIAESEATFLDWCRRAAVHPRAAVRVDSLRDVPEQDEPRIVFDALTLLPVPERAAA